MLISGTSPLQVPQKVPLHRKPAMLWIQRIGKLRISNKLCGAGEKI